MSFLLLINVLLAAGINQHRGSIILLKFDRSPIVPAGTRAGAILRTNYAGICFEAQVAFPEGAAFPSTVVTR